MVYRSGPGSSFEENSLLCEYLASHGYVVVGSAYPEADGSSLGIEEGSGSIEVRLASELPIVDWRGMAVGGHSPGAQAALKFAAQPDCIAEALRRNPAARST